MQYVPVAIQDRQPLPESHRHRNVIKYLSGFLSAKSRALATLKAQKSGFPTLKATQGHEYKWETEA